MTLVRPQALRQNSRLHTHVAHGDFLDCYAVRSGVSARHAATVITAFPSWVTALVGLRNTLVRPFGLLSEGPATGERLGPFPITEESPHEIIAGFDDRHLDFRISVQADDGVVSLATWVHPHNIAGRAYLAAIMPFHILIARDALRRVAAG